MSIDNNLGIGLLSRLPIIRKAKRRRESSWDKTGGNRDFIMIKPNEKSTIASISGAGCITHIWFAVMCKEKYFLRKIVLKMFWDGEENPSVEVPIGDFFGMGHAETRNFNSLPLNMSPENGRGFNCFFPMPFSKGAKVEIVNECKSADAELYYYIDYETYDTLKHKLGRFHAQWRRQNPCEGIVQGEISNEEFLSYGKHFSRDKNITGKGNYVILEAEGEGHYVGCNLNIHNLRDTKEWNWYGDGDDMIFIDDNEWPPTLHGTGTEDYFNTAWCPTQEFSGLYHGIILAGDSNWAGKITFYRFHIEDPVLFSKSIKVTIEHGHANKRSDDYSSTAYWYQTEPHKKFPPLLAVEKRLP